MIDRGGRRVIANAAGKALLAELPREGKGGALGLRELDELFRRAALAELGPAPIRVESPYGTRYFNARFAPTSKGCKTVLLADVSLWKIAAAERSARQALGAEEGLASVCARCGALRSGGYWGGPGSADLLRIPLDRRSHGLCPACSADAANSW